MHAALWKLYRLRIRGSFRAMAGKLKTVRGATLAVFTLLIFALMLGPNLAMAFGHGPAEMTRGSADSFREIIPVVMLAYAVLAIVTSLGERAIYFSPSDVDFLFPAPFSRRQLLLYKILGNVTAAIWFAVFIPLMMIMNIRSFPAAAVGAFLGYLMLSSLTMCVQLAAQIVSERAFTLARKLLLGLVLAAAAVALVQAAGRGLDGSWKETLAGARHSPAAEIILAPFVVFANIIAAEQFGPDTLGWAALGAILVVGVYAVAVRLDANYLETAARVSQKIQERRRRAATGSEFASSSKRALRSSRVPQLPWLGGAGPLVWRHMVQALRGGRGAIVLVMIATVAIAFGSSVMGSVDHGKQQTVLPHMIIVVSAYISFIYSAQSQLRLQGDYKRMDLLKSLPLRPLAVVCGETLVITAILTLIEWLVFAVTAVFAPGAGDELLAAGLFALPFNWILVSADNLLFLLYPSPQVATGSDGFLKMGRTMLVMLGKMLVLGGSAIVVSIPA
jgi:ABC-2 type transport system permease protein